jgi:hypothetical protein
VNLARQEKLGILISKGKWNYILRHGVVGWGVMTAALFSLFQYYFGGEDFWSTAKFSFIAFPIGGIGWGAFMWWFLNKEYNKPVK